MKFSFPHFSVFLFSCFLVFLVAAILLITTTAFAQVVKIPDPNLREAIRETLQLPEGVPITQQEMLRLRNLDGEDRVITDLTGLEFASNLIGFSVSGNWTVNSSSSASSLDLSPLSDLTELKVVFIHRVRLSDMTVLANLTQLTGLVLIENGIRDITPLAGLVNLDWLTLLENPIADLSALTNLTQLKELQIRATGRITDITPLANLTNLIMLNLHGNQIVDISPLAGLTQLEKLVIDNNQIVDISPLANLTQLKELKIDANKIVDFSPLQGLSLTSLQYDQVCELPDPPVQDRIGSRTFPSIPQGFDSGIVNLPALSYKDRLAYHDLWWQGLPFDLRFQPTPPWYQLVGDIDRAVAQQEELLAKNPNMIFLVNLRLRDAGRGFYPEDWFGWLRDENGNRIKRKRDPADHGYFIDFTQPAVQDVIVQQAISVAQCGLYDGIMFDAGWSDAGPVLVDYALEEWERQYYRTFEQELEARVSMIQRIRAGVPDDFLILCNSNWAKLPITGSYINGGFMETFRDGYDVYQNKTLAEIEDALLWYEANVREPRINCVRGEGIPTESPDSPNNRRWMRLFTTMSLTLSDGYALYSTGHHASTHFWYSFWDADLGQPVGPTARRYQEDIEGLYIREFTNGWAVYNRSGEPQTITLPAPATPVSNRGSNAAAQTHLLPDLDGEIYLKTKNPADVNGDGVVNILDLVHVANNFGKADPDLNGDGVVNILDLTLVAKHLSQNAAAPSQLALIESIPSTAKEVIAVQRALTELEAIPNKSHGVQIAIELLRHYLSIADPNVQETKLLSNYPNPCNPDTWIPYQLSEGSTVTVKIYDVTGSIVRTIQVGHKPAGYYLTRERAIYWDGRNQNREPVSSGVYFYTFNTDTYTQTRRMVILK